MVVKLEGFCICAGEASGTLQRCFDAYRERELITAETILVLDYPATSFLPLMRRAQAVISAKGTDLTDGAGFLCDNNKPSIYGVGDLAKLPEDGQRVDLVVTACGTAELRLRWM